jgi:hypothetical protein
MNIKTFIITCLLLGCLIESHPNHHSHEEKDRDNNNEYISENTDNLSLEIILKKIINLKNIISIIKIIVYF